MATPSTTRQRRAQLAAAATGILILLAGGITGGIMASEPGRPGWQPASVTNLVLLEGPASGTYSTGNGDPDGTAAQLVNGLVELHLSQWADNRATDTPGN